MKPPTDINGYDPTRDAEGFTWDAKAAQRAVDFYPQCLVITADSAGAKAGQPFTLSPFQRDFTATLHGWKRPNGKRRYREAVFFMPRKNGKTEFGSGQALFGTGCDGEQKSEVYSLGFTREQASRIFEPASIMVRNSPLLSSRFKVVDSTYRIVYPAANSYFRALAAEASSAHGKNPHYVLFDELHTQPNRKLYDGMRTGQGSRTQPLFVSFSTAGYDKHSICWESWNYARQVRDGVVRDPHFLPCIYEMQEDDDWTDEEVWKRVNPNLGTTISMEFLRSEFRHAQESPAYENTFRNWYLNEWTEQAVRWLSLQKWDACAGSVETSGECFAGLDLSSTRDLSAFVLVFRNDDKIDCKAWFWVPAEYARQRALRDRVPYDQWIEDGWITATPGESVDYDFIRADIERISHQYQINRIAIDRWNAVQLRKQLEGDGHVAEMFGQGYKSMSPPAKVLETLVVNGNLRHDGNPVLRWMANNVAIEKDAAENIKPSKKESNERIDGIVALVMALGAMGETMTTMNFTADEMGL